MAAATQKLEAEREEGNFQAPALPVSLVSAIVVHGYLHGVRERFRLPALRLELLAGGLIVGS